MPRYIDADALINTSVSIVGAIDGKYPFEAIDIKTIENAPAADVAPVVYGRWIAQTNYPGTYSTCSVCEQRARGYAPNMRYCPNCGAKMDGGAKNNG